MKQMAVCAIADAAYDAPSRGHDLKQARFSAG